MKQTIRTLTYSLFMVFIGMSLMVISDIREENKQLQSLEQHELLTQTSGSDSEVNLKIQKLYRELKDQPFDDEYGYTIDPLAIIPEPFLDVFPYMTSDITYHIKPLDEEQVLGRYAIKDGKRHIILTADITDRDLKHTLLHEYVHHLLHTESYTPSIYEDENSSELLTDIVAYKIADLYFPWEFQGQYLSRDELRFYPDLLHEGQYFTRQFIAKYR